MLYFLLTLIKWTSMFSVLFFIFRSFDYNVSFLLVISSVSIGTILSLIPISVGGLGIKEGSALAIFSHYNVPAVTAGSALLLQTIIKYIIGIIVLLVI